LNNKQEPEQQNQRSNKKIKNKRRLNKKFPHKTLNRHPSPMSYVVKQHFWDLSHRDPEIKGIEATIMVIMKMMLVMIIKTHTHTHCWLISS